MTKSSLLTAVKPQVHQSYQQRESILRMAKAYSKYTRRKADGNTF